VSAARLCHVSATCHCHVSCHVGKYTRLNDIMNY
jgi:hypothetical protein